MKVDKKKLIAYCVVIIIQIAVFVYWGCEKSNLFVDELYSMGYANSFVPMPNQPTYITTSDAYKLNSWIDNSELKRSLLVFDENKVINAPVSVSISRFLHWRNYYGLLNIAQSFLPSPGTSHWPGIILNIIIYIPLLLSFLCLMTKLGLDFKIRCLAAFMFGLTPFMITAVDYVRFYALVILAFLVILNLLYKVWCSDEWKTIILSFIGIGILSFISYKNSELTIAFIGAMIGCYIIVAIIFKKRKQMLLGCLTVLFGFLFVLLTTDYISILSNPNKYASAGWFSSVASFAAQNVRNPSWAKISYFSSWLSWLFGTHFFASYRVVLLSCVVVTIYLIVRFYKTDHDDASMSNRGYNPILLSLLVFWILFYMIKSFSGDNSRVCIAMIIIISAVMFSGLLRGKISRIKLTVSENTSYLLILIGATAIYSLFLALADLDIWRYYCFGFVSVMVIFWYLLDRLYSRIKENRYQNIVLLIMSGLVVVNAVTPFFSRGIDYIYEEDRPFIGSIRERVENDKDIVVALPDENDFDISKHALYDCVNMLPDDAKLYIINLRDYRYVRSDLPDRFILWSHLGWEPTEVLSDLESDGYKVSEFGEDHTSRAYNVEKSSYKE